MHAGGSRSADRCALTALIAAEQRRVLRLFEVLEDVAAYSAGYLGMGALHQTWASIAELLLRMADEVEFRYLPALSGTDWYITDAGNYLVTIEELRKAVDQVGAHRPGTEGWWLAVRDAERASKAADRLLLAHSAGG